MEADVWIQNQGLGRFPRPYWQERRKLLQPIPAIDPDKLTRNTGPIPRRPYRQVH